MESVPFIKMHGAGNDFVIVDARARPLALGAREARAIADRRTGVGCDQLILVEPPRNGRANAFMRILNADGDEAGACGNGTRCVAALLMKEGGGAQVVIETAAGLLAAEAADDGAIKVDMGPVRLDWREIPLARAQDTLHLELKLGPLADPVAVNVGNPHAVFFVDDPEVIDLGTLGPKLERHPLFPERANIGVAKVLDAERIRLRVWERGAGLTRACGTAACAALVAASRRELSGRAATIELPGGALRVEWRADDHATLAGPIATSFTGVIDPALIEAAEADR
jgi:diaminopimelate epimerase